MAIGHAGVVALIDLVDDTFVAAHPAVLAAVVADPARWPQWWPGLTFTTTRDRSQKGRQWRVDGPLVGTAEVWLEPWGDGVLVHHYLRVDPAPGSAADALADGGESRRRWAARERARLAQDWKRVIHALKDDVEQGRRPGTGVRSPLKAVGPDADHAQDES